MLSANTVAQTPAGSVIELAGMVSHCDFDEQATVITEDGRLRPDLVVRLPNGRNVVVEGALGEARCAGFYDLHDGLIAGAVEYWVGEPA